MEGEATRNSSSGSSDLLYRSLRLCNQVSIGRGLQEFFKSSDLQNQDLLASSDMSLKSGESGDSKSMENWARFYAQFLGQHYRALNPKSLGAYLCKHLDVLREYLCLIMIQEKEIGKVSDVDLMQKESDILYCLRKVLGRVLIAGQEAQAIDNVLLEFSKRFVHLFPDHWLFSGCSRGDMLAKVDIAHILSYSLLLLNTDLNNESVKKKMTKLDFIQLVMRCLCEEQIQDDDSDTDADDFIHERRRQNPASKYRCPALRLSMFLSRAFISLTADPISLDGGTPALPEPPVDVLPAPLDTSMPPDSKIETEFVRLNLFGSQFFGNITYDDHVEDELRTLFAYSDPPIMWGWLRKLAPLDPQQSLSILESKSTWLKIKERWSWKKRFFILVRGQNHKRFEQAEDKVSPYKALDGQCLYYFYDDFSFSIDKKSALTSKASNFEIKRSSSFTLGRRPKAVPSESINLRSSFDCGKSSTKIPKKKADDLLRGIIPLDGLFVYPIPLETSVNSDIINDWYYFEISPTPPSFCQTFLSQETACNSPPSPPGTPSLEVEEQNSTTHPFMKFPPPPLLPPHPILKLNFPAPPTVDPPKHLKVTRCQTAPIPLGVGSDPMTTTSSFYAPKIRASKKKTAKGKMIPSNHQSFILGCRSRKERDQWVGMLTGYFDSV